MNTPSLQFARYDEAAHQTYRDIYAGMLPASDFSPNNLIVWLDINSDLQYAVDNDNIVLSYTCPFIGDETVFTVIGGNSPAATVEKVFQYQKEHNLQQVLTMVPEDTAERIRSDAQSNYLITEDTENFDYIYDVYDKADLYKPSSSKFRRTIHHFIKQYGDDVTIREVDLNDDQALSKLTETLHAWRVENVISNNDKMGIERTAIERYIKYREILSPQCLTIHVHDKIVGFSIYHYPPQGDFAIINHIKCDYNYTNIFDFTFFCIMNHLKMDGIHYANGEQDLGIDGIRNYKHKLGPTAYIRRFNITPGL